MLPDMRKGIIGLSLLLTISLIPAYSATPPKSGSACSKQGITKSYQGKKFTCIKSGKKLIWDQGVKITPIQIVSQTPSPTSSPTPSPTPTPTPTQTPTPTESKSPARNSEPIMSFDELRVRYLDFHYLAWKRSIDQISKSAINNTQIIELVGPNSKKCSGESIEAIRVTQRLFAASALSPSLKILYADKVDEKWLYEETAKLLRPNELVLQDGKQINPHSVNSDTKIGVEWIQDSCTENRINFINGSATAHGYTHIIQKFQFTSNPTTWGAWGKAPHWLFEGGATFSDQIIFFGKSESSWMGFSKDQASTLKEYGLDFFNDFLRFELDANNNAWGVTDKYPNQRVYDVGSIVCEILIAMKGPNVIIDLYSDLAKTQDFELSFKNKFGVTWTEAKPEIAFAIYKYLLES